MPKPYRAGTRYWGLIEPFWLSLNESWDNDPQPFLGLFAKLPAPQGHLYAAHWCQSEVRNGGLLQFFSNTTGLLSPEALAGFRAVGAVEWATVLSEAMSYFGHEYPRERTLRLEKLPAWDRGDRASCNPFRDLDERFFRWLDDDGDRWARLADAYADRTG